MASEITPAQQKELAPTGKLRVGINHGNFLLVNKDSLMGEPKGVAADLARELAKCAAVPLEFVSYKGAGELASGVSNGEWDVAFLGIEPERATEIAFTPAYLEIPVTFLVPAESPIQTLDEVDREGVRIAVSIKSAYDLFLSRTLKQAELVGAEGIDGSYQLFVKEKLEALAGLRPRLESDAEKNPGLRVLEGQITTVEQAIGTPKSRETAMRFLREFVEDVKASGLVAQAIEKHGVRGVSVAPKV
jgi:polar amino acid transport system substrate-binding protein